MSLYDSLLERLDGKQYSNYFSCCCIFHDDHNPSMFVYENGFRCASCGKKGSLKFLEKALGVRFHPVTRSQKSVVLPRWRDWEQKWNDLEGIALHAHQSLKKFKQFQGFFKMRKIETFIDVGHFGYINGWATFPVYSISGKLVDIVVRAVSGKGDTRYTVSPNLVSAPRSLYIPNPQRVIKSATVYVVFGLIDSWTMEAIGQPCVTGITGKSIDTESLRSLCKRLIIVPDYNEERDAHRIANTLGWRCRVKELSYPEGCKDTDDVRVKFGNECLMNLLGVQV